MQANRQESPYLSAKSVTKRYGTTTVLDDVSLEIPSGCCVALAGENGAGKSSLVKIISGVTSPTAGTLTIDGVPRKLSSPRDAQAAGVAFIPQELAYCAQLTVAENLLLGRWPHKATFTSPRQIRRRAERILTDLGLPLAASKPMADLTLGQRQMVEIGKALSVNARLLILDEPTSSLNTIEADQLLATLIEMKKRGVALLYISHRLDEYFRLADEIVVLRNGKVAARHEPSATFPEQIVSEMLGRDYKEPQPAALARERDAEPVLRVTGWTTTKIPRLDGISFEAYRGEVLGVFGLVGSGCEAIARGLAGDPSARIRGSVTVAGRRMRAFRNPAVAKRHRVASVPAERKSDGLALGRPIREAVTVLVPDKVSTGGLLRQRAERRLASDVIARFGVRCRSERQPVGELSGGNQQKVLVASRLLARPAVLVLHEPTRGVDIGARGQIHTFIVEAARNGAASIVVTSDLAEAVAIADRILVIRDGCIVAELRGDSKTETALLRAAAGAEH